MSNRSQPRIAITLGDPGGIGPEVVAKALQSETLRVACRPVVVGNPASLREAAEFSGIRLNLSLVESPDDSASEHAIPVIQPAGEFAETFSVGKISAINGRAAIDGGDFANRKCF